MILQKLKLTNFKSYYGENEFSFVKGLNIISGSVGSGKTSLFEGFQWLLEQEDGDFVDSEFILNKAYEKESLLEKKDAIVVKVVLVFEHNLIEYTLSKSVHYSLFNESFTSKSIEFELGYMDDVTGQYYGDTNTSSVKRKIATEFFPQKIRDYILFKGENLNSLIDFNNPETLRNAVDRISYLKYFENIHKTVVQIKEKIENKVNNNLRADKKKQKEFADAELNLGKYKKEKGAQEDKLKRLNEEIKNLTDEKQKYIDTLATLGEFPKLKEELKSIKNSRKMLLDQREGLLTSLRENYVREYMISGFDLVLANCEKIFQKYNDDKNKRLKEGVNALRLGIPGDALINKMLLEQNCNICGRDFEINSKEYKTVESHLDKNKKNIDDLLSDEEKYLDRRINDLLNSIPSIKAKHIDSKNGFISFNNRFLKNSEESTRLKDLETDVRGRIDVLLAKNSGIQDIDAGRLTSKFSVVDSELSKKEKLKSSITIQINHLDNSIKRAKSEMLKNSSNLETVYESSESKSLNYLEELETTTYAQIGLEKLNFIEQIEQQANVIQESIIKNPNLVVLYSKIDRNNYTIEFEDKNGNPNPGHGAQNDLAKLSIISSVLKLSSAKSNEVFPFIVDAPASAFDDTIYKPFVESLAGNFEQSIVILKDIDKDIDYYVNQKYTDKIYQLKKEVIDENGASMTSSVTKIKQLK